MIPTGHPLYEPYGRTMHEAQRLEVSVQGLAIQLQLAKAPETEEAEIERLYKKTIGWIENNYAIPETVSERLSRARTLRNYFAHEFFIEIGVHVESGAFDIELARQILDDWSREFESLGEEIDRIAWEIIGVDPHEAEEVVRRALSEDSPLDEGPLLASLDMSLPVLVGSLQKKVH